MSARDDPWNPFDRDERSKGQLERDAAQGDASAMERLSTIEDYKKYKKGDVGPSDAVLRQQQALAQQQIGAQGQALMANVAPAGPVGTQSGTSTQQLGQIAQGIGQGAAAASGQAFDTQSRLAAQAHQAYLARINRQAEFQAQRGLQETALMLEGIDTAMSTAGKIATAGAPVG